MVHKRGWKFGDVSRYRYQIMDGIAACLDDLEISSRTVGYVIEAWEEAQMTFRLCLKCHRKFLPLLVEQTCCSAKCALESAEGRRELAAVRAELDRHLQMSLSAGRT